MKNYFSYDVINGDFNLHGTLEEAKNEAFNSLEFYRDNANVEGWPEDLTGSIGYGVLSGYTVEVNPKHKRDYTQEEWDEMGCSDLFDEVVDYKLQNIE